MNKIFKVDQSRVINRLWFFAGLILFLLICFGLTREIVNRRQINKQISDDEARIAELSAENLVLNGKINNWDKSGELEAAARVRLGLERPGEQTIVINRASSASAGTAVKSNQEVISLADSSDNNNSQSNIIRWWNYFFQ